MNTQTLKFIAEEYNLNLEELTQKVQNFETIVKGESQPNDIKIVNYTDKSFVLIGNTVNIKENIKALGGKWNANLRDGMKGWIFSKSKEKEVREAFKLSL